MYFENRRISQNRNYLSLDVAVAIMASLVLSKLDYANALFSCLSLDQLGKLQKI